MVNIYWKGAPGGRILRAFSMSLLNSGLLKHKDVNLHAAGIVFLEQGDLLRSLRKKCKSLVLTGYQHGGGYHYDNLDEWKLEWEICDNYVFWTLEPKSIHRWGFSSILRFRINDCLNKSYPTTYLIMPVFSESIPLIMDEVNFINNQWYRILKILPSDTQIIWHPRDVNRQINFEKKLRSTDKCIFVGHNPTLIWFCVKFGIDFVILNSDEHCLSVDRRLMQYEVYI